MFKYSYYLYAYVENLIELRIVHLNVQIGLLLPAVVE